MCMISCVSISGCHDAQSSRDRCHAGPTSSSQLQITENSYNTSIQIQYNNYNRSLFLIALGVDADLNKHTFE